MGIKGLHSIITELAPKAISQTEIKTLFGRKVAVDASMSIYQFLIAVRQQDGQQLMNESGETTSHLMGLFYRTIRMVENGIKPAYVFDGKPPELKSGVLKKRFDRREEAKEEGEEAKETGTTEDMDKISRRTVKVTREHNEECRKLLKLMGMPYLVAPTEAEAQCAELCRGGLVYGVGSEDMDTLTFNSPVLLRHLTFSEARKMPIDVIKLDEVLKGLEFSMSEFIDFCMLCGCDYLDPLKGVGPKTALKLIRDHENIKGALAHLREGKNPPPDDWAWKEAKELFRRPDVTPANEVDLKWEEPDIDGLVEFLVKQKGFNEERVRKGADKLKIAMRAKQQGRLDGFFKPAPGTSSPSQKVSDKKRKADTNDTGKNKKAKKDKDKDKDGGGKKASTSKAKK